MRQKGGSVGAEGANMQRYATVKMYNYIKIKRYGQHFFMYTSDRTAHL